MSTASLDDRRLLIEIIGHELAADATEPQRAEIRQAIREHEAGVRQLAHQIRTNPRVQKPVPVLLSKLRTGAHRAPTRNETANANLLDRAHQAYIGKLADLDKHDAWSQGWTVDDAIAYAIDYICPGDAEIEAELRKRAGLEPYIVATEIPAETIAAMKRLAAGKPAPRKPPAAVIARAKALVPDDDDIPGYGDQT